jgi:hypothetical protein
MSSDGVGRVGPYEILSEIGRGGMGVVYLARDTRLERDVAIKALPDDLASDADRMARFEREAKLLASLSHPNIATVHGLEELDGRHYLVLEHVGGETLDQRLLRGRLSTDEALRCALDVARAVEAAHECGIVHRDLKPANVKVTETGLVKVLDFGLAKALHESEDAADEATRVAGATTVPGAVLGTPGYLAPEQARGRSVDERADVFGFGCLLYEMLCGQPPFPGETVADSIGATLHGEPAWDALPADLPAPVQRLLERCLRKEPRERLQHIGDARIELEDARSRPDGGAESKGGGDDGTWGRVVAIGVVVAAVLAVAAVVWSLWPERRLVYLIDTTAPMGVYDDQTRDRGGTNADDLTDVLGDLPIALAKEAVSPEWRREHQVMKQQPTLVVIHRSAFAHQPGIADRAARTRAENALPELGLENPYVLGWSKLVEFLGYVALGSPGTRFVVYSRGFGDQAARDAWTGEVETRFPELKGKVTAYNVPVDGSGSGSFREPGTAEEIERVVRSILEID